MAIRPWYSEQNTAEKGKLFTQRLSDLLTPLYKCKFTDEQILISMHYERCLQTHNYKEMSNEPIFWQHVPLGKELIHPSCPERQFRALPLDSLASLCSRYISCRAQLKARVCRFTRDVNVILLFKDAFAHGQSDLQLGGGKAREVHVQIAHEVRKLPVLEREDPINTMKTQGQNNRSQIHKAFRCYSITSNHIKYHSTTVQ